MRVFGHPWIESEPFFLISNPEEIKLTPPNSIVKLQRFDATLMHYCQNHAIAYAVRIYTIKEGIFANLLGAKYITCSPSLATKLMPIAQNYLFDTQILARIENESEIEEMAIAGVDGVILPPALS